MRLQGLVQLVGHDQTGHQQQPAVADLPEGLFELGYFRIQQPGELGQVLFLALVAHHVVWTLVDPYDYCRHVPKYL